MARSMVAVFGLAVVGLASAELTFLAIGDWGGTSDAVPVTPVQPVVAGVMERLAAETDAEFVLTLGDNFYVDGINAGNGGVDSPRFKQSFEDVYTGRTLTQIPWYIVLGNHDHYGDVNMQIAYTQKSERWECPSQWYTIKRTFTDRGITRTLEIVVVDTVVLMGNTLKNETCVLESPNGCPEDPELAEDHWAWLETTITASDADYLWVAGHHNVYCGCSHGPVAGLQRLRTMLEANEAHYVSGHDHCVEHIEVGPTTYVVAGTGKTCCYKATRIDRNPRDSIKFLISDENKNDQPTRYTGGFASFHAGGNWLYYVHHNQLMEPVFTSERFYPRAKAAPQRQEA